MDVLSLPPEVDLVSVIYERRLRCEVPFACESNRMVGYGSDAHAPVSFERFSGSRLRGPTPERNVLHSAHEIGQTDI